MSMGYAFVIDYVSFTDDLRNVWFYLSRSLTQFCDLILLINTVPSFEYSSFNIIQLGVDCPKEKVSNASTRALNLTIWPVERDLPNTRSKMLG